MPSEADKERLFKEIVDNRAFFYRVAYRLINNNEGAEELLQDSILHAFEKIHQFNGGSIRAWVKRIILTKFLNICRKSGRFVLCEDISKYDFIDTKTAYLDPILVRQSFAKLDEFETKLIKLYIYGYDYVEISDCLHIPISTARVKIHRIKERIRSQK